MFDKGSNYVPPGTPAASPAAYRPIKGSESIKALIPAMRHLQRDVSDSERLDQLRALQELQAATVAAAARIAVDLDRSQADQSQADQSQADQSRAASSAQIALARRDSPHAGAKFLRFAKAMVTEMPCTLAALERGRLTEYRAMILVKETSCLTSAERTQVDGVVASDPERLATLGNRQLEAEVKVAAYRTAPEVVVNRAAYAVTERRVSIRPAPDTMVWLTALPPVAQGVAAYAALAKHADTVRATKGGDARSRGQVMADTMVERLTGQASATAVPVEINLIMTDRALLARQQASSPPRIRADSGGNRTAVGSERY